MNRRIGQICVGVLAVILVGMAVHTPATIWIGTMLSSGVEVMIKAWKELLLLTLLPLASLIVIRRPALRKKLQNDKLFWLIKAYIILHVIMLLVYWQGWWPSIAGLMIDLRYVVAFMLGYVIVAAYPWARRYLLGAIIAGAVIIIGFATVQHALPHDALKHIGYGPDTVVPYLTVDQNYDFIRLSSTMRGPNPMGAYAASVVLMALAFAGMGRLRERRTHLAVGVLGALSMIALWFSYSRSAKLALLAGLVTLVITLRPWQYIPRKLLASLVVVATVAAVTATAIVWQTTWFSNVVLHTNPDGGSLTQSNDEHWQSLIDGSERMLSQPFGAGVGSTGSASLFGDNPLIIENQYLFIAHEVGWLGLVTFIAIFAAVLGRLYRHASYDPWAAGTLASGVGLAVVGLVLPVWADDTVSIIWWSLAAIVLATNLKPGVVNDKKMRYANKRKNKLKQKGTNNL